jgi:uncharacterized delta-60 repeat protein
MKTQILCITLLLSSIVFGQDGSLDLTFNVADDCYYGDVFGANGIVSELIVQPDQKTLVAGSFTAFNGSSNPNLVRLLEDGSVDPSFSSGFSFGSSTVKSIALDNSGKIIAVGNIGTYDGEATNHIVRINSDGSYDNTFDTQTAVSNTIHDFGVLSDQSIVIGGDFTTIGLTSSNRIGKLNADGTHDLAFSSNIGTGFNNLVTCVEIQADDKILILGIFTTFNGLPAPKIIRLNPDGTVDNTFNAGTGISGWADFISLTSDNKIIIGGSFTSYNGNTINRIARLNIDGSLDMTFNVGSGFDNPPFECVIQPDDKVIVVGNFTTYNGINRKNIVRLNADGTIDLTLDPQAGFSNIAYTTAVQTDGKIVTGGDFLFYNGAARNRLARINSDGQMDHSYNPGSGFNGLVHNLYMMGDGKILAGGDFTLFNGSVANYFVKLKSDGSLDSSFNIGSGFNGGVVGIDEQSDGKIVLGGSFNLFNGNNTAKLVRLNADGSFDNTFMIGSGFGGNVYDVVVQSDDKIIVVGNFTTFNGAPVNRIVRLNSDGSLDASFNVGTGFNNAVNVVKLQSDGKILVGGAFTSYNGSASFRMVRLNTDGSKDFSYNLLAFGSAVNTICIQADDKVLVGGNFANYGPHMLAGAIRLNTDATADITFDTGTGFAGMVRTISVQSNGKILVGGDFGWFNSLSQNYIIRLNENGSKDNTFNIGSGFNNPVYSMGLTFDEKVLAAGSFSQFGSQCKHGIARLNSSTCNTISNISLDACDSLIFNGNTYSASGDYVVIIPNTAGCDSVIFLTANIGNSSNIDTALSKADNLLISFENSAQFQWLDCQNAFSPISGENSLAYFATLPGSYAVEITKDGCKDTSYCYLIDTIDFYNAPWFLPMYGECYISPTTSASSCDALGDAFVIGGLPPYTYDWLNQNESSFSQNADSLCLGAYALKITDALGDSVMIDYYVPEMSNYYAWFDPSSGDDTIYFNHENCAFDFSLPIDSVVISDEYFVSTTPYTLDFFYVELTYYQLGNQFVFGDTVLIDTTLNNLIELNIFCPTKSTEQLAKYRFTKSYLEILGLPDLIQNVEIIFPNPVSDRLYIVQLPAGSQVTLIDQTGRLIQTFNPDSETYEIDVNGLSSGTYFVQISSLASNRVYKIMVM